jgi:hypothetical protein
MTDLSPAAQAVLDAFAKASDGKYVDGEWQQDDVGQLAAALRAAADQMSCHQSKKFLYSIADAMKLRAIATELEGQP